MKKYLQGALKVDKNLIGGYLGIKTQTENQKNRVMVWAKNGSDVTKKLELEEKFTQLEERKRHHNAVVRERVEKGELPEDEAKYHFFEGGKI